MTWRGISRDAVVVFQGDADLRDGSAVDVNPAPTGKKKISARGRSRGAPKSAAKAKSAKYPLPGFGARKGRKDIVDTAEYARELRRRTSTRKSRG
jgi:hypothetical protein